MRIWIHAITILRLTRTKSNKYVGTPGKQAIKKCSFALIPLAFRYVFLAKVHTTCSNA